MIRIFSAYTDGFVKHLVVTVFIFLGLLARDGETAMRCGFPTNLSLLHCSHTFKPTWGKVKGSNSTSRGRM